MRVAQTSVFTRAQRQPGVNKVMTGTGAHRFQIGLARACIGGILSAFAATFAPAAAPPNDNFANAIVLTGTTNFTTGSNAGATFEEDEPFDVNSPGGKSVWWKWQAPFTGTVLISTEGSSFDTLLLVYAGHSFSDLQLVAENDDAGGFGVVTSSLIFRAFAGETFHISVDGFEGATGAVQLVVARAGSPAPTWSLPDLSGQTVHSSDFRNKVLMLDFWNTTCDPCVEELPHLARVHQNFSPEGLALFSLVQDPSDVNVEYFVQTRGIPYDVARMTPGIETAFGGTIAPTTKFIIDCENRFVGSYVGGSDYAYYEKILRPLLRGSTQVQLSLRPHSAAITLAWPGTEFGYVLESTVVLGGTNWSASPFPVVATNDENTVTVPTGAGGQFFRLRKTVLNQ
jgi:thiol-disulfide isomerase/thioredoxin